MPRLADVYERARHRVRVLGRREGADAAGALVEVARRYGALERLWVCCPDLELLRPLRAEPAVKLVHSDRRTRDRGAARAARVRARRRSGIDAMNLHHSEWTAGLVSLFHRFDVRAFAWDAQEVRHLRAVLRMGIDAVYCDRPDRMVATVGEWTDERVTGADGRVHGTPEAA